MKNEYKYKDGQVVKFDNGAIAGHGKIVGASTIGQAGIGVNYIVEVEKSTVELPNETYPFKVISMFECYIIETSSQSETLVGVQQDQTQCDRF